MTCNITNTPPVTEPLPLYRRDPETVSVHSAAPSYVSEAPTYHSRRPSIPASNTTPPTASQPAATSPTTPTTPRYGLPAPRYAPGFQSRAHGSIADINTHNYNISHWSNINSSHASRQYHAVARRRASEAANTTAILNSLSAVPPSTSPNSSSTNLNGSGSSNASNAYPVNASNAPASPLEDPYLVGEAAAGRARSQRIYREMCLRGEDTIKYENKSWNFLISQMADWEEREQSWSKFRDQVGRTKLLGRRIGLRS